MRHQYLRLIMTIGLFSIASAAHMEGFTLKRFPMTPNSPQDPICVLDGAEGRMQAVNQSLKASGPQDKAAINARYGQDFQAMSAQQVCRFRAASLGITQLPAVVIDQHYVIYGDTDMAESLNRYHHYREAHPNA